MKSRYQLSRNAARDLESIWDYIASDNLDAADELAAKFRSAMEGLAENPEIGHLRQDLALDCYKFWAVETI